jgi:hypothetical protein
MYSKTNIPAKISDLTPVRKKVLAYVVKMETDFVVDTLEGPMPGKAGDYFICSIENNEVTDVWLIDAERFEKTYEAVK